MSVKQYLKKVIRDILKTKENIELTDIELVSPPNSEMGDLSFSCFELAKLLKQSPDKIGENLTKKLEEVVDSKMIATVESVGPYVNFRFSGKYFIEQLREVLLAGEDWGRGDLLAGKVFLSEHTDPNLFKEFHIGHLMTNAIGESLTRLAGFNGADVKQVTFQGDVGLHVAKTLYGMKNFLAELPNEGDVWQKQAFLGKCYAWGNEQYEINEDAKRAIVGINKKVYSGNDEEQDKLYQQGKKWSLEYFENIYKIVGSKFDHYFLESETAEVGRKIAMENLGKVFVESQGAVIFPGSEYGLHDRVFINSVGLPTYEAKDIGLFVKKWERYNPFLSLVVTGGEQKQYFAVVKKAAGLINKEWEEKTVHLAHGTLRLKDGKMSSRSGKIIRAKKWIDETTEIILEKMKNKDKKVAEKVALAAIKYSVLKVQAGKDIVYNEKESLSFEGDTGPYLQYTYVRAKSVLRKVKDKISFSDDLSFSEIPSVGKLIGEFPEVVEKSLRNYSPHIVANYLHRLAMEFNSFYGAVKILDKNNPDYLYNLCLVKATAQILKNGLYLLGIEVVEEM